MCLCIMVNHYIEHGRNVIYTPKLEVTEFRSPYPAFVDYNLEK